MAEMMASKFRAGQATDPRRRWPSGILHAAMNDRSDDPESGRSNGDEDRRQLSPWQVLASTLAAAFGVQSSRNRERDFSRGKASHFIIAGIVFTLLFVVGMILVVKVVLSGVG
jgi:hypothetical protein